MVVGSLFSGIGGFDLGLERAGHEIRWQVEIDKDCQRVLRSHFDRRGHWAVAADLQRQGDQPAARQLDGDDSASFFSDVTRVGKHNLAAVDLICGGFPCQDLSVAGKRAGLAQYFGVAQRRRRVFIVGCLGDRAAAASVLFEPESCAGDSPPRREKGKGSTPLLEVGARTSGDGYRDGDGIGEPGEVMYTLQSTKQHGAFIPEVAGTLNAGAHPGSYNGQDAYDDKFLAFEARFARNGRGAPEPLVPPLKAESGQTGKGDSAPLVFSIYPEGPSLTPYLPQRSRVHSPEGVAPTLAAEEGRGQGVPTVLAARVRRLTPTECERLQGFPDGWTDGHSDSARYRMLGNAVCVPVAEWIGRRMPS